MKPIPLEDEFADIISKAQSGLGLTDTELLKASRLTLKDLALARAGKPTPETIASLARALRLGEKALAESAAKKWRPSAIEMDGLEQCNTPFFDMTVNAYVVWDPKSKAAAFFDSGADAKPLLECVSSRSLHIEAIFLTHTHGDHVAELIPLMEATGAPVFCCKYEPWEGAHLFNPGDTFSLGALRIETRLTRGHSPGGTTYLVTGLERLLAIVGDALFAGSMGSGKVSYQDALETNKREIFSLPDETVIAPGHGPITTVAEEKVHNPFFAV
jgi:glyoxylase-like metal-dependent hydrolase (beta-lactamase superfamily II)